MYGFMMPNLTLGRNMPSLTINDLFSFIGFMIVALFAFIILYRFICYLRDIKVTNQKLRTLTIIAMSLSMLSYITLKVNEKNNEIEPKKEIKQEIKQEKISTTKNPNIKIEIH